MGIFQIFTLTHTHTYKQDPMVSTSAVSTATNKYNLGDIHRLRRARQSGGYHPGSDITASIWQIIQQSTIQHQLNSTHDMYNETRQNATVGSRGMTPIISTKKKTKNPYNPALTFTDDATIRDIFLRKYVPLPPTELDHDYYLFQKDINIFERSVTNLSELRRPKRWCKYAMSDGIIRFGCISKHPLHRSIPGWLVDVMNVRKRKPAALLWCTDVRGVNNHLGAVCNLINLHHLFQRIECINGDNFTAILAHLTVLSTVSLNPINRRGMKYPNNAVSSRTFEDVKRSLLQLSKTRTEKWRDGNIDYLDTFFIRLMTVMPHKIGTNSFDLMIKTT